jgi:hypothetical protein
VAKSNSGKWVSRVGAAGGGKTYRKARPGNYYGILAVIVVVGLIATIYSRYEYQNPVKKHKVVVQPAVGSILYAGLSVQACGKTLPYLTPDPTTKLGFIVEPDDVVRLSPVSSFDAGNNATLKTLASEFPGLITSTTELALPKANSSAVNPATTYKNGEACAKGTPDASKIGKVEYAYWTSFDQKTPKITTNPAKIKFSKELRVTLAFEPTGVVPSPPSKTTDDEMVYNTVTPTTTTTTTLPTATTTTPTTTTTSASTTTTTKG